MPHKTSGTGASFVWRGRRRRNSAGYLVTWALQDKSAVRLTDKAYWLVRRLAARRNTTMLGVMELIGRSL